MIFRSSAFGLPYWLVLCPVLNPGFNKCVSWMSNSLVSKRSLSLVECNLNVVLFQHLQRGCASSLFHHCKPGPKLQLEHLAPPVAIFHQTGGRDSTRGHGWKDSSGWSVLASILGAVHKLPNAVRGLSFALCHCIRIKV